MASNPFYVEPPNGMNALQMLMQGYDFSDKRAKQAQQEALYKEAGQHLQSGGSVDNSFLGRLIAGGPGSAGLVTAIGALGKADTTDELKEYKFDMAQRAARGQPQVGFGEWKTGLKQAGATRVNTNVNTGEKEYDKVLNKNEAERFIGFQKNSQGAQDQLNSLSVMENAMKDPRFYSGAGAETFALPLKRGIAAFGGDPNAAASMETFRAQANKAVIDSMGGSLGSGFSNADRDFVVSQVPNLANTPDGNKTLLEVSRKVAGRKIEIGKLAREYASKNGGRIDAGFDEVVQQFAEKNPLFPRSAVAPAMTPRPGNRIRFNPATGNFE